MRRYISSIRAVHTHVLSQVPDYVEETTARATIDLANFAELPTEARCAEGAVTKIERPPAGLYIVRTIDETSLGKAPDAA